MTRTFCKRSYSLENIGFIMNGRDGKKGQPCSIITHLLYKTDIYFYLFKNILSPFNRLNCFIYDR